MVLSVTLVYVAFVGVFGCRSDSPEKSVIGFLNEKVVPDDGQKWEFQPAQEYKVEFGRGSGWVGLATIKLESSGKVVICEPRYLLERVQAKKFDMVLAEGTCNLTPEDVLKVANLIKDLKLNGLAKAYHGGVYDGTQWVFFLQQGGQQKSVYFDNKFPKVIERFAKALDGILEPYKNKAVWQQVAKGHERDNGKSLWESIK